MNKQDKISEKEIEAVLGLLGFLFVIIGGFFNLIGTTIAGGILLFFLYKSN